MASGSYDDGSSIMVGIGPASMHGCLAASQCASNGNERAADESVKGTCNLSVMGEWEVGLMRFARKRRKAETKNGTGGRVGLELREKHLMQFPEKFETATVPRPLTSLFNPDLIISTSISPTDVDITHITTAAAEPTTTKPSNCVTGGGADHPDIKHEEGVDENAVTRKGGGHEDNEGMHSAIKERSNALAAAAHVKNDKKMKMKTKEEEKKEEDSLPLPPLGPRSSGYYLLAIGGRNGVELYALNLILPLLPSTTSSSFSHGSKQATTTAAATQLKSKRTRTARNEKECVDDNEENKEGEGEESTEKKKNKEEDGSNLHLHSSHHHRRRHHHQLQATPLLAHLHKHYPVVVVALSREFKRKEEEGRGGAAESACVLLFCGTLGLRVGSSHSSTKGNSSENGAIFHLSVGTFTTKSSRLCAATWSGNCTGWPRLLLNFFDGTCEVVSHSNHDFSDDGIDEIHVSKTAPPSSDTSTLENAATKSAPPKDDDDGKKKRATAVRRKKKGGGGGANGE
eukprot:jgi/Bigna1/134249/aug1.24_g8957